MPPVPPYIEPGIPGSIAYNSGQLYTHSNKFPIERQITLSSTEKNFKIPILNDLKKRTKGAVIAPDVPPKRTSAWTHQEQMHQIYTEPPEPVYRASFCPEVELYGNQATKDDPDDKKKVVTKTYHALKDIISGKFKQGKDPEKPELGLNNVPDQRKENMQIENEMAQNRLSSGQVYPPQVPDPQYHYYAQQLRSQQQYHLAQYGNYAPQMLSPGSEKRSAQQIERDNLKQKNLEARRTMSHPHLLNMEGEEQSNPPPQPPTVRRGSLGNILEPSHNNESDDGGFLNRNVKPKEPPVEVKRRGDNEGGERASSNIDSGRGSAAYSSGRRPPLDDVADDTNNDQGNDSEWVDIVEKELRHILEPKLLELSLRGNSRGASGASISSITPPIPSGETTLTPTPKSPARGYERYDDKKYGRGKVDYHTAMRGKQIFGLDSTDITSTTTRSMDLESILDAQSDSDANLSATDTKAIRKQLEGLENMYSEVLKFLGVNKRVNRYQPTDPRLKKRHGSMSSLATSSVSSVRRDRRYVRGISEERRMRGRQDPKTTARRFQRLEAHVVTLARSVAHLSSEMRTQHLVVQEIESVRQEVAQLRAQTNMINIRSQSTRPATNMELPALANPSRVKKLTKFFGDEPPLLRLFLRKLGYEKYANAFEHEKIGMIELPYLSEERLQKMGIPLGPRLRIMQEAQISVFKDNTLCIV